MSDNTDGGCVFAGGDADIAAVSLVSDVSVCAVDAVEDFLSGQRFWFHDTALESLQEAAERFLENMWDHLRELSDNNVVTVDHIHLWKRQTNFKPRFKSNTLSLCKIFKKQL